MKKIYFFSVMLTILSFGACDYNDRNFEGLDDMVLPTDVKNLDYTLTDADYAALSGNPKKNLYFSAEDPADNFLPAWLAKTYYAASASSVVRVTFNYLNEPSALLKPYTAIEHVSLMGNADYVPTFYPEGSYAPFLNETTEEEIITKFLKVKYPAPAKGDYIMVSYNYSEDDVQTVETPVAEYNFEAEEEQKNGFDKLTNWYVKVTGDNKWKLLTYSNNKYVQFSANGASGVCEAWLVTSAIGIEGTDKNFAFDVNVGYFDEDCLSVCIATDFDGKDVTKANWKDVTARFTIPQDKKYKGFVSAGTLSLSEYAGQTIRIAFKYTGDGANHKTTTYQIDNVIVGKDIPNAVKLSPRFQLFQCTSAGKWFKFENKKGKDVFCPTYEDYASMGEPGKGLCFSSSILHENYIPTYLANHAEEFGFEYPQNGDAKVVIYRYNNKTIEVKAKEYIYSTENGRWEYNNQIVQKTRQYAYNGSEWIFDPSLTITLSTSKSDKATSEFYQIITDWVKANKGEGYVTSYGNNDYYYGGSAYQNNFDFRVSAWRKQNSAVYESLSDDQLEALMYSRLEEAFLPALESLYPNVEPVEGVKVIYTIHFSIYDGTDTKVWKIGYEVSGKGKFTYVAGSLKEVK